MRKGVTILAAFAILLGGYVIYGWSRPTPSAPQESAESFPSDLMPYARPAVPENDTSNWKTYRNEKYGFEVKYPAMFDIRTSEAPFRGFVSEPPPLLYALYLNKQNGEIIDWEMYIYSRLENIAIDKWMLNSMEAMPPEGEKFVIESTNFSSSGIEGRKFRTSLDGNMEVTFVVFNHDRNLYSIRFVNKRVNDSEVEQNQPLFNAMLSTFKFIK